MKITNAYQAILAKLGGNQAVNIPTPRNKYEKLLNDIPVNGGGGSSEDIIADTQTVTGVAPSDPLAVGTEYVLTTTESYGDPASYNGKLAVAEIIRGGESLKLMGTISTYTVEGETFARADLGDGALDPLCCLNLGNDSAMIQYFDTEPGEELAIKVSVTQPNVLFVAWDFIEGSSLQVLKTTWREINEAMTIRGIPVMIMGTWMLPAIGITYNDHEENPYQVVFLSLESDFTLHAVAFATNDPDGYPQELNRD